jgi:cysteine sulfinate desulfinase/cysteine desulfurase-like protein
MLNFDLLEVVNTRTPWVGKSFLEKVFSDVAGLQELVKNKGAALAPRFFGSQKEAFYELMFALIKEKTLGKGKNHVLIADHLQSVYREVLSQFEVFGITFETVKSDIFGKVDCKKLEQFIYPTTLAVIMESFDPVTGVEQPVKEIATLLENKVHLHVIIEPKLGLSHLVHKMHSVQMDNILLVDPEFELKGATSLDLITSCCRHLYEVTKSVQESSMQAAFFKRTLERGIESLGGKIFFKESSRHPLISVFGIQGLHGELLAYALAKKQVAVSIGGGHRPPLHTHLMHMGFADEEALTAIHISLQTFQEEKQIITLLDTIEQISKNFCLEKVRA